MNPTFLVCHELKVYKDMAFKEGGGYKDCGISVCECLAHKEGRPCKNRGLCIEAKEYGTWKRVSSKSWKE